MNSKFYNLPSDRQKQIINGALKVFSESSYRQASTIDIARDAGISKGLLFFYFKNKKELYFYLYEYCVNLAALELEKNRIPEERDFFEMLLHSLGIKCKLMKEHRCIYDFIVRVYQENDSEIAGELAQYTGPFIEDNFKHFLERVDKGKFKEGIDVTLLLQSLNWCADGFMRSAFNSNKSIDEIDKEFGKILNMYKQNFYKEETECTTVNMETEKIIL